MLLKKTVKDPSDKRHDNADKKRLFAEKDILHAAAFHREQWAFIKDETIRENIAYQMQYLEFLAGVYNEYQVYLTAESLLCKDIMVIVAGVIEAALFDLIASARKRTAAEMEDRLEFTVLLGMAYHDYGLLAEDEWHYFHELRKVRNYVHLKAVDFREYDSYTIEETNEGMKRLEEWRGRIAGQTSDAS